MNRAQGAWKDGECGEIGWESVGWSGTNWRIDDVVWWQVVRWQRAARKKKSAYEGQDVAVLGAETYFPARRFFCDARKGNVNAALLL